MAQRTQGELHVDKDSKTEIFSITGRLVANCGGYSLNDGSGKTKKENQANAEYIVKCCNNYNPMLEALKEAVTLLTSAMAKYEFMGSRESLTRTINRYKEVIRQAEGGK